MKEEEENESGHYCPCPECRKNRILEANFLAQIPDEEKKEPILTTRDLNSNGKTKEQRYYDKEKTIPRPFYTTGDVALSEGEEATKKIKEVMDEAKKSKEKNDEK